MDMWKFYDVTHREHVILNPTNGSKLAELVRLLGLPRGARVLDIACGKAEFLIRLAEAYGVCGIGVDISPFFAAEAERRLKERGHAVIVAAEGAGQKFFEDAGSETDASGNILLKDIGLYLKTQIKTYFDAKGISTSLKYIDPSYIIRSIKACPVDSVLCTNLAINAIKFCGDPGRVTLDGRWLPERRELVLAVRDNGPGIPDELAGSLFDPFVTSKDSGRGLGLALVAKLIRDHGGVVDASNVDDSTVFRVLLPLSTSSV